MRVFSALTGAVSFLYSSVIGAFVRKEENVYIVDKNEKQGVPIALPHRFAAQVAKLRQISLNK